MVDQAGNLLIADDNKVNRLLMSRSVELLGHKASVAENGKIALQMLADQTFDALLLDIEMPRMDGFELASHMKNEQRLSGIPIIMITSRTGSKHREHAMQLGVDQYMGKPYQEEELISNISQLVG